MLLFLLLLLHFSHLPAQDGRLHYSMYSNTLPGVSGYFSLLLTESSDLLRSSAAPAAESVQYDKVKYNITTKGNRFVGAGPEVDAAWSAISYDGRPAVR